MMVLQLTGNMWRKVGWTKLVKYAKKIRGEKQGRWTILEDMFIQPAWMTSPSRVGTFSLDSFHNQLSLLAIYPFYTVYASNFLRNRFNHSSAPLLFLHVTRLGSDTPYIFNLKSFLGFILKTDSITHFLHLPMIQRYPYPNRCPINTNLICCLSRRICFYHHHP